MKIVLVWASNNAQKYWNIILKDLLSSGHDVIPVNPKERKIEWLNCFSNILEIEENFDIVVFVVPEESTFGILENLFINSFFERWKWEIWFQPGSYNDVILKFLRVNNIKHIAWACIMKDFK